MKAALNGFLPKVVPDRTNITIIAFDGVGNMENDLPKQLRALAKMDDSRILILRDNDNGVCSDHKNRLFKMAKDAGLIGRTKVRIVCQMLEGWFIGDSAALSASGQFKNKPIPKRLKTCDPDSQQNPKKALRALRDGYNEIVGAEAISPHMQPDLNRSSSFRHTIQAIRDLTAA